MNGMNTILDWMREKERESEWVHLSVHRLRVHIDVIQLSLAAGYNGHYHRQRACWLTDHVFLVRLLEAVYWHWGKSFLFSLIYETVCQLSILGSPPTMSILSSDPGFRLHVVLFSRFSKNGLFGKALVGTFGSGQDFISFFLWAETISYRIVSSMRHTLMPNKSIEFRKKWAIQKRKKT